ncbi:hypothetical protein [Microcystis phage Mel-JY01]
MESEPIQEQSRDRWPISPGDRVFILTNHSDFNGCGIAEVSDFSSTEFHVRFNNFCYTFNSDGTGGHDSLIPGVMKLYDDEEPFKNQIENAHWLFSEAVKLKWKPNR